MKQAIILCSGGLDSVTLAHYIKNSRKYSKTKILFFNYGQKSLKMERHYSKRCANETDSSFFEVKLNSLSKISTSSINTGKKVSVSKSLKDTKKESESWYVPSRNTIFISYALSLAESDYIKNNIESDIFLGFKSEGKEAYPDTTEEYVNKINSLSKTSCIRNFKILAPFIKKDKEDIIKIANKMGLDLRKTYSCYVGDKKQCGSCLACRLRKAGFYWAGIEDTSNYKS